mmetsp:Transcript_18198/g.57857  ORF Transcript_18198/g.57857 Transcript_18198/m.57857 type:complete len:247 (+) Transcript_18198:1-741(+)
MRPPRHGGTPLVQVPGYSGRRTTQILALQYAEGLLQRLDFRPSASNSVLVSGASVDAGRLQLVIVVQGCGELLLRVFKLLLGAIELALGALLPVPFVPHRLVLRGSVRLRVGHENIVLPLGLILCSAGLSLQACKVRLDDIQHAKDAGALALHPRVRRIPRWGRVLGQPLPLLHERYGIRYFGVELLEYLCCLRYRNRRRLGFCDRHGIRGLLLLPISSCLRHGGIDGCDLVTEVADLLRKFRGQC